MHAIKELDAKLFEEIDTKKCLYAVFAGTVCSSWVLFMHFSDKLELNAFFKLAFSAICFFGAYFGVMLLTKEPLVKELVGQVLGKLKKKE